MPYIWDKRVAQLVSLSSQCGRCLDHDVSSRAGRRTARSRTNGNGWKISLQIGKCRLKPLSHGGLLEDEVCRFAGVICKMEKGRLTIGGFDKFPVGVEEC